MTHPTAKGYIPTVKNHSWCTPEWILAACRAVFHVKQIDLDPCSNAVSIVNAKTEWRLTDGVNGLERDWSPFSSIFVNPPYGQAHLHGTECREWDPATQGSWGQADRIVRQQYHTTSINDWIKKCAQYKEVIALVPVTPETAAWKQYVWGTASAICFVGKRISFIDPTTGRLAKQGFPKPHALIYWGEHYTQFQPVMREIGTVIPGPNAR